MLKPQDLLVTFKILGYEESINSAPDFQFSPWIPYWEKIETETKYDRLDDYVYIPEEKNDFEKAELEVIESFLINTEPNYGKWTFRQLAKELFISLSEANQSVKRAINAGLLFNRGSRGIGVNKEVLKKFIKYGAGVSFFVNTGKISRGIPTAYAAPVFDGLFVGSLDFPPVWPCARGTVRGVAVEPLFKSVTKAVMIDPSLYQALALVDIYRVGTSREKNEADQFLKDFLR